MTIPKVKEIKDQNVANIEGEINQTTPSNEKSYNKVIAAVEAVLQKSLYNFAIDRAKQNLALTATGDDLDKLGAEYGVPRKEAVSTVLTATLPGTDTTVIPATIDFVGDANGIRYANDASVTIGVPTSGVAELTLTAKQTGTIGNLQAGDTLSIGTQVAGAETIATVAVITGETSEILTTGADREEDDDYRLRILDVIRAPGGGGNAADYRNWAQEVAGVVRAYPYGGDPAGSGSPPERTVYVEADTKIDPDGIPPASLLDDVRDSITYDPETGQTRQPLGLTDDTLFVEPITRTEFFVRITGLTVDPSIETAVKGEIETQLTSYFRALRPFVDGVDAKIDDNSLITDLTVSDVVQDVLKANGGSAQSVAFDISKGGSIPEYQLGQGETSKLAAVDGVTYV
jgi:phage-related baseplate assembly protein